MRVLLTGASSFTGMWFAEELARRGHEVVATMTAPDADAYPPARRARVQRVVACAAEVVFDCRYGHDRFLDLLSGGSWDVLGHHAAEVKDYRSPAFDTVGAVAGNTHRVREVLDLLAGRGARVVLTGSVFEGGEGAGSEGLPHFSAYGLSKSLSAEVWQFEARQRGVDLSKFVITNPFGPHEEPRFTGYLVRTWLRGETASVRTPAYVRDNIHVSLLARAYGAFAEAVAAGASQGRLCPSGYVESQGRFAERVASEMRPRLGLPCGLQHLVQTGFEEPRIRIGTDPPDAVALGWDEGAAWDAFAAYYAGSAEPA